MCAAHPTAWPSIYTYVLTEQTSLTRMPKAAAEPNSLNFGTSSASSTSKQPSRKGKAAWRKNIDISGIEASLENSRAAERAGLAPVDARTASSSLFVEDRLGDEVVAKAQQARAAKQKKPLKSLAILHANKDIGAPAMQGRARKGVDTALRASKALDSQSGLTPEQRARRHGMSKRDIDRLRRVAGRDVRGAFGAIEEEDRNGEHTQRGPQAVVEEARYDVWSAPSAGKVRAPATTKELRTEDVSLTLPDAGQSYNPSAEAHEALLNKALRAAQSEEERRQIELEYMRRWQAGAAAERQKHRSSATDEIERLLGMDVDVNTQDDLDKGKSSETSFDGEEDETDGAQEDTQAHVKRDAKRKTKQQRARARRVKDEIRAQEALKASKRSRAQLQSLRALKKELSMLEAAKDERAAERKQRRAARLAEKVGMFKLPKRDEDVQLGEDLSESLRGLKPQGNLLRDRLYAFQKRGLAEPKHTTTQANAPRTRRASARTKEYETHSYKRFS